MVDTAQAHFPELLELQVRQVVSSGMRRTQHCAMLHHELLLRFGVHYTSATRTHDTSLEYEPHWTLGFDECGQRCQPVSLPKP